MAIVARSRFLMGGGRRGELGGVIHRAGRVRRGWFLAADSGRDSGHLLSSVYRQERDRGAVVRDMADELGPVPPDHAAVVPPEGSVEKVKSVAADGTLVDRGVDVESATAGRVLGHLEVSDRGKEVAAGLDAGVDEDIEA